MFTISITCLILLIVIAAKVGVFIDFTTNILFNIIESVMKNTYFSGIMCSVLAVVIIYTIQVRYSKRMLKKDFRCNEIIEEIYDGIERYCEIMDKIPQTSIGKPNKNFAEKRKQDAKIFFEFYKENFIDIDFITISFSYKNNDILIESIQSCFFINLNFKLLDIINNIKNRLPNLRDGYPEIKEAYEKYESDGDEKTLLDLGNKLPHYFIDLRFSAIYWKKLLDYLNYDPTYIKLFVKTYNSKYDIVEDIKQPKEILDERNKEIDKEVKKSMRLYKIKHFWCK